MKNTIAVVDAWLIYPTINFLKYKKCPYIDWCEQVGLPLAALEDKYSTVPSTAYWRLLELAAEKLNCQDLGFQISEFERMAQFDDKMAPIMRHSFSLIDAITAFEEVAKTFSSNTKVFVEYETAGAWLCGSGYEITVKDYFQKEQIPLLSFLHLARYYLGEKWQPTYVSSVNSNVSDVIKSRFPKALVLENSRTTGMFFTYQELGKVQDNLLKKFDFKSRFTTSFSDRLYKIMYTYSRYHIPNRSFFEKQFNLSARQLRSRLEKEGTSFREVSNKVKLDLSKYYLLNTNHRIIDISVTLGYKNSTHFSSAFKKLTGLTPKDYRQQYREDS